jgi:tetratricopeptide (TPR) repeat protein
LRLYLVLLGVVLVAASAAGWWYHSARPEVRMSRGRDAIRRGDWDAVEAISDRLEASGETDRANLLRGEALAERKRWPQALQALNRILDEGPLRLQAAVTAGRCLAELSELQEAHRVFTFVLSQDKDNVDAHRGMAAIAYDLGNLTTALHHLDEVARLDDSDGRPYRLKGMVYTFLNRETEAEAAYREALKRNLSAEFRQQALLELAERMVRRTRYQEAVALLDERKGDGEDDLAALTLRAELLLNLGRFPDAERLLDRAVVDYPDSGQLWSLLGQIYLGDKNRTSEAVRVLERAVERSPGDYQFRFQLANAFHRAGRKEDEEKQRRKAEELRQVLDQLSNLSRDAMRKPWDREIRYKLAELAEKIHNTKLAGMWYKAAQACQKPDE